MKEPTTEQILSAIEEIVGSDAACDAEYLFRMHPEGMTEREKQYATMLGKVYTLAHGFNKSNSCYHVHEEWRKL